MFKKILLIDQKFSQKMLLKENQKLLTKLFSLLAHSGDSWYIEIVLFSIWAFSRGIAHTVSAYFAGSGRQYYVTAFLAIGEII